MGALRRTCATVLRRGPLPKFLWANSFYKNILFRVVTTGSRWYGDDVISGVDASMRRTDDDDTVIDVVGCDMATSDHVTSQ